MSIRPFWGDPLSKGWKSFAHTLPSRHLAPNILVNRINSLKTNIFSYMYMACYVQCICKYVWFQIHKCQCVGVVIGVQTWMSTLTLSLSYMAESHSWMQAPGQQSRQVIQNMWGDALSPPAISPKLTRILEAHKTKWPHVDPGHPSPILPYAQQALYLLNHLHRQGVLTALHAVSEA